MDALQRKQVELIKRRCDSIVRLANDHSIVGQALDSKATTRSVRDLTDPPSPKGAVRKLGIALAVAPEPLTTGAGVVMVAASFTMKEKKPANLRTLQAETENQFSDLDSLR
jgi:hypothetical protein